MFPWFQCCQCQWRIASTVVWSISAHVIHTCRSIFHFNWTCCCKTYMRIKYIFDLKKKKEGRRKKKEERRKKKEEETSCKSIKGKREWETTRTIEEHVLHLIVPHVEWNQFLQDQTYQSKSMFLNQCSLTNDNVPCVYKKTSKKTKRVSMWTKLIIDMSDLTVL